MALTNGEYPSRRAPACPKAKGIPRGEPASRDGWTHPLPKAFGALPNKGRENHQASSNSRPPSTAGDADAGAGGIRSSLHYVPKQGMSTTSKANAGAGGMTRQCSMPKRGTPVISKASQRVPPRVEASGGTNSRCKVTDMTSWSDNSCRKEPTSSSNGRSSWNYTGSQRYDVYPSWKLLNTHQDSGAGGLSPQLFDSRAGEPLWEEHYHEQNYPGDGAADGGGLAMKRKLCLEQQQLSLIHI